MRGSPNLFVALMRRNIYWGSGLALQAFKEMSAQEVPPRFDSRPVKYIRCVVLRRHAVQQAAQGHREQHSREEGRHRPPASSFHLLEGVCLALRTGLEGKHQTSFANEKTSTKFSARELRLATNYARGCRAVAITSLNQNARSKKAKATRRQNYFSGDRLRESPRL